MSLIKKHTMTEKQLAANRRNQKLCNDPVTDPCRERIRAALQRFGYNAQAEEDAMRALGEDPAHFQELLEALWEEWNPTGGLQEGVVIGLARALWLANRAARMQEGCAVRQAQEVNNGREDQVHAQMMGLKITEERLRRLAASVKFPHYVTTPEDLEKMKNLHAEGDLKKMGEMSVALFYRLQAPGTGEGGLDSMEAAERMVAQAKEIFGIGMTPLYPPPAKGVPNFSPPPDGQPAGSGNLGPDFSPAPPGLPAGQGEAPAGTEEDEEAAEDEEKDKRYPYISAAEWEARKRPRQLLENLLTRLMHSCQEQRKVLLKESLKGPSPYERAAEIAPTHPNERVMRKMQETNFREVRRFTNLLLKIKRYEREKVALERDGEEAA